MLLTALLLVLGLTTNYFFPNYEETDGVATKYYPLPGGATAVRKDESLNYLHTDHLSSTKLITDNSGLVTNSFDYYPYGSPGLTGLTGLIDRFYTGQILDDSANLYYYNARDYNPATGAFISADQNSSLSNRYAYAGNNPVAYIDNGNDPLYYQSSRRYLASQFGAGIPTADTALRAGGLIYSGISSNKVDITSASNKQISESRMKDIDMAIWYTGAYMYNWTSDPNKAPNSWGDFGTSPDIQQMNKTSLGRVNIAFALAIAGQESSFGFGKLENTVINAHLGERFMIGERIVDFSNQTTYLDRYFQYTDPVYKNMALQFEAMIYSYRMKAGYAGITGSFDLIDAAGNINWEIAGDFYNSNPENENRQLWIKNVGQYYESLRNLANKYPGQYDWLFKDVRDIK